MQILREEGPAALYKGFVPKVLRLAPGGGVLLLVVEFTLNVFRQGLGHFHESSVTQCTDNVVISYSARPALSMRH